MAVQEADAAIYSSITIVSGPQGGHTIVIGVLRFWKNPRLAAHLDVVLVVKGESVVDTLRKHNHVSLVTFNADPILSLAPHIKVSWTAYDREIRRFQAVLLSCSRKIYGSYQSADMNGD